MHSSTTASGRADEERANEAGKCDECKAQKFWIPPVFCGGLFTRHPAYIRATARTGP